MPAVRTPRRAEAEAEAAERADDLRLHVVDLALQDEQALIDPRLFVGIVDEVLVVPEAILGLGEVAELFVDHALVEDCRGIVGPLLLRVLKELQRGREVVLRVEEAAAREELSILRVRLPLLLQLALELELELQLRHERLLSTGRKELVVPIDLRLRLGIPPRTRQEHGHVVEHARLIGPQRVGLGELLIGRCVIAHLEELPAEIDRLREFVRRRRLGCSRRCRRWRCCRWS